MHCRHRLSVSSTLQQLRKKHSFFSTPHPHGKSAPSTVRLIRGNFLWQLPPFSFQRRPAPRDAVKISFSPFCPILRSQVCRPGNKKNKDSTGFFPFFEKPFQSFSTKSLFKESLLYSIRKWTFFELVKKQAISKHFSPVSRPTKNGHSCGGGGGCT